METIWTAIEPYILEAFGLIITAVIGFAARQFSVWTGVEIEKAHREALHSALMSGAEQALEQGPSVVLADVKRAAINHAYRSVPDAIAALVPGDTVLDTLATRYARTVIDTVTRGD